VQPGGGGAAAPVKVRSHDQQFRAVTVDRRPAEPDTSRALLESLFAVGAAPPRWTATGRTLDGQLQLESLHAEFASVETIPVFDRPIRAHSKLESVSVRDSEKIH